MDITEVVIDIGSDPPILQAHTTTAETGALAQPWPQISLCPELYWWPMFLLLLFWIVCEYAYAILIMAGNIALLAQTYRITDVLQSKGRTAFPIAVGSISYAIMLFKSSICKQHVRAWSVFLRQNVHEGDGMAISALNVLLTLIIVDIAHRFLLHGAWILFSLTTMSSRKKAQIFDVVVCISCLHREMVPIPIWYMIIDASDIGTRMPVVQLIYLLIKSFAICDSVMRCARCAANTWSTAPEFGRYEKEAAGSDACPVCFDPLQNPVRLDCTHIFCEECICRWAESEAPSASCPMCRTSMRNTSGLIYSLRRGPARYGPIHFI